MRIQILTAGLCILLAGCSAVPTGSGGGGAVTGASTAASGETIPKDAVAVYSWEAQGSMVFRCTYDEKGFYWAFLRPEGKLTGSGGRVQAVLGPDFSVTARDGSSLTARIVGQGPLESARDLRTAVFRTQASKSGMLRGVRWYARRQPNGGMPLATCTASQRGHLLRVPFRARYVFYR